MWSYLKTQIKQYSKKSRLKKVGKKDNYYRNKNKKAK